MRPAKFNQPPSQTLFENRLSERDPKAAEISTAVRSMVKKSRHAQANLTLFEDSINIPNNLLPEVRGKIYEILGSVADKYVLRPEGYRLILEAKVAVAHGEVPKAAEVVIPTLEDEDKKPDSQDKTWTTQADWRASRAKKLGGY